MTYKVTWTMRFMSLRSLIAQCYKVSENSKELLLKTLLSTNITVLESQSGITKSTCSQQTYQ